MMEELRKQLKEYAKDLFNKIKKGKYTLNNIDPENIKKRLHDEY